MTKRLTIPFLVAAVVVLALSYVGSARAQQQQYPMADMLAQKIIDKYNNSNCVQLAQMKSEKPTGEKAQMEQRIVQALKNDPQMRQYFINKIAAPIANKMFECGMIP